MNALFLALLLLHLPAPPLSWPAYTRAVHHARIQLDNSPQVTAVAGTLRHLDRVRLPDGKIVRTDLPRLARELRRPAMVPTVRRQLDRLDDAFRQVRVTPVNHAALHRLDVVLHDPVFRPSCTLLACLGLWLLNLWQHLFPQAARPRLSLPNSTVLLLLLPLLATLLILSLAVGRGVLGRIVPSAAFSQGAVLPRSAAELRREAGRLEAAGDFRTALRLLLGATLLGLQERGLVELRVGLTTRDVLRSAPPSIRPDLQALVEAFERSWYGHLPLSGDEYQRCRTLATHLLQSEWDAA